MLLVYLTMQDVFGYIETARPDCCLQRVYLLSQLLVKKIMK
jgi:hypothetical protein